MSSSSTPPRDIGDALLWGLPVHAIEAALGSADGNEIGSGKLFSPQSSAALAINAFGVFIDRPGALPSLPGTEDLGWPATSVRIEAPLPFPWHRGRKPNLDILIETATGLIGVESKRFEPFDTHGAPSWSDTYWSVDWTPDLARHALMRDASRAGEAGFVHIEEAQLVKHALGLATATAPGQAAGGKTPWLVHLRAEPEVDRRGRPLDTDKHARHGAEVARYGAAVAGDRVRFVGVTYAELLSVWQRSEVPQLRAHAAAIRAFFGSAI
ncbi:hypothetical protein [Roseomonas sp. CECT 9278]|uniref:hypothetical protein n=1 Tax=Roseomonas sp. CECT 9278 TaxID=2845823 RepID=UPI001E558168|nr:hypothetical protein [Roseomonas sp. CECT 9278]CAH0304476.1 hypothetical protein ROS9278_04673 [Roseomonas sp. CECT 9278]